MNTGRLLGIDQGWMRNSAILPGLSAGNRRATGKLLKTPFSVKFDAERRVVHV